MKPTRLIRAAGRRRLAAVLAVGLAGVCGPVWGADVDRAAVGGLAFLGRVIEKGTGTPVAGATVVVRRVLEAVGEGQAPEWVGDSALKTDAEGRFSITLTPEQANESRLELGVVRVAHPDFVSRRGLMVPVANLLLERRYGDAPYFTTVTLERGEEFTAEVVTPEGRPAAGVPYEFSDWGTGSNRAPNFANDNSGRTDAEGRVRIQMPKARSLIIRLLPAKHAPYVRFWGNDRPDRDPNVFVPTGLGRLVLGPGPVLSGRLVDVQGRPLAGQRLVAKGNRNQVRREVTTAADGTFRFAPLRPGNYTVHAAGQGGDSGVERSAQPLPRPTHAVGPAKVYLRPDAAAATVELRALPSVRIEVRFVDAKSHPARGSWVGLAGKLPAPMNPARRAPAPALRRAASVNDPEPEDTDSTLFWSCRLAPDAQGRVVFHAPRGLVDATVMPSLRDETVSYRTRLKPGAPLKFWGGGSLGEIEAERPPIEVVSYRAPTVLVRLVTAGGEPVPDDARVFAAFNVEGGDYGERVVRQAVGRFRTSSLMPDHEYEFGVGATGYVAKRIERLSLAEGATKELTLVLRKPHAKLVVGDRARPFTVRPTEGPDRSLEDFRGTLLLLHVWSPYNQWDRDLHRLRTIRDRYPVDRLAMLGLCMDADAAHAARVIDGHRFTWPQAILRDRGADPLIMDYDAFRTPNTFLIGPEGTILARDLAGEQVDDAVADLLAKP